MSIIPKMFSFPDPVETQTCKNAKHMLPLAVPSCRLAYESQP